MPRRLVPSRAGAGCGAALTAAASESSVGRSTLVGADASEVADDASAVLDSAAGEPAVRAKPTASTRTLMTATGPRAALGGALRQSSSVQGSCDCDL